MRCATNGVVLRLTTRRVLAETTALLTSLLPHRPVSRPRAGSCAASWASSSAPGGRHLDADRRRNQRRVRLQPGADRDQTEASRRRIRADDRSTTSARAPAPAICVRGGGHGERDDRACGRAGEPRSSRMGTRWSNYGRAIFWGDYVLLGPANDPAGVLTGIEQREHRARRSRRSPPPGRPAAANFVSRGGTPGTTVQEHAIWALTTGVATCTVSDANGGGTSPSTATGDCASHDRQLPELVQGDRTDPGARTSWPLTPATSHPTTGNNCYVFTDRGTFKYLQSDRRRSATLKLRRRQQRPGADSDQQNLLVNSFHLYGDEPGRSSRAGVEDQQRPARPTLLNWITTPAAQEPLAAVPRETTVNAPFRPDAAPTDHGVTTLPPAVKGGKTIRR